MLSIPDSKVQLIDPVKGTLNVLKSAVKVPCLKRVVLTSSIASVLLHSVFLHGARLPEPGIVIDETWFLDPVISEQKKVQGCDHPRLDYEQLLQFYMHQWEVVREFHAETETFGMMAATHWFSSTSEVQLQLDVKDETGHTVIVLFDETMEKLPKTKTHALLNGENDVPPLFVIDNFNFRMNDGC